LGIGYGHKVFRWEIAGELPTRALIGALKTEGKILKSMGMFVLGFLAACSLLFSHGGCLTYGQILASQSTFLNYCMIARK
jgi:hypothetical protein